MKKTTDIRRWDDLSIAEKSKMMEIAIRNGITDLPTIKAKYNEFAEGGDTEGEDTAPTSLPVIPEEAQAPYNFVKNYVASDAFKRMADAVSPTYYKDHNDAMEHVRIFNTRGIYDSTVDKPFTIDDYNDYCWGKSLA